MLAAPEYQGNTPLYSGTDASLSASCQAKFKADIVDFQLGRFFKCRPICVRPSVGMHFIRAWHEWISSYAGTAFPGVAEETAVETIVMRKASNWGLGPRLGIDFEIGLPACFSISTHMGAAVLAGEIENALSQQDSQTGVFEVGSVDTGLADGIFPYLTGKIGLNYFWCCQCFTVRFELAYEWHHYQDLFFGFRYNDQRATKAGVCAPLTFQGISLGARITA